MPSMFEQTMKTCDDCDEVRPLGWWRMNIRICAQCRAKREAAALSPKNTESEHD